MKSLPPIYSLFGFLLLAQCAPAATVATGNAIELRHRNPGGTNYAANMYAAVPPGNAPGLMLFTGADDIECVVLGSGLTWTAGDPSGTPHGILNVGVSDAIQVALDDLQTELEGQISGISLTPGPQGPAGPAGQNGQDGENGLIGPTGPQGISGSPGSQGVKGDKGDQGETGGVGPIGPNGIQGIQGIAGSTGSQGPKGDKGDTGDVGIQGPVGLTGATGAQGIQGIQGNTGSTGSQGIQGLKGDKGDTGNTGATGSTGPAGANGADGALSIQRKRAQTDASGNYTWTFTTPFAGGVVPVINVVSETSSTTVPQGVQIVGTPTNTAVTFKVLNLPATSVLGIVVLGAPGGAQAWLHMSALTP